jgi:hypothetical protein
MDRLSGIVFGQALLQISGNADIALADSGFTLQQIDTAHLYRPSSAEASEGILLRYL